MRKRGFTLAELLIALAILGTIATFTIPKVLVSQQDSKFRAIGKEAAAAISSAYQAYVQQKGPSSAMKSADLTPYLNYVALDTTSLIDQLQGSTTIDCSGPNAVCMRLHNGAMLHTMNTHTFGGSGTTNAVWFYVDPDGKVTDGTLNGPGKSVCLFLYYSGKLASYQDKVLPTVTSSSSYATACTNCDPPWFGWN